MNYLPPIFDKKKISFVLILKKSWYKKREKDKILFPSREIEADVNVLNDRC